MRFSKQTILWFAGSMILLGLAVVFVESHEKPEEPASRKPAAAGLSNRSPRPVLEKSAAAPVQKGRRYFPTPTTAEWQRLAATLTPEKARQLLERDRLEEKNLDVRAQRAWLIINQLCQNGYPHEAWELIETSPGDVRSKGLGGFFRDAGLSKEELISMMETMPERDRSPSLFGYWSRFSPEEFTKLDLKEFPIRSASESGAFRRTIEELIGQSYDAGHPEDSKWIRHDLLAMAISQANDGKFNYYDFKTILEKDPSKDGFTYWEAMKAVSPEIRATQTSGQANYNGPDSMVIRSMAIQDPEKTMAMTLVPGSHEANYIHIAMGQWLEKDYDNAKQWVDAHQASFTPDQQERAAVAFVRAQVARGEYEEAAKWLDKVQTPRWVDAIYWHRQQIEKRMAAPAVK